MTETYDRSWVRDCLKLLKDPDNAELRYEVMQNARRQADEMADYTLRNLGIKPQGKQDE